MTQPKLEPLIDDHRELLASARQLHDERYREGRHHVAAALRTRAGEIVTGINLEASVGPTDVCAEAVAIGTAATEGFDGVETIVAVCRGGEVLAPCGNCRQLISDFSNDATVIVPDDGEPKAVALAELLPRAVTR